MKTSVWCVILALGLGVSAATAMTELETLRARYAKQALEIRRLKEENNQLRSANSVQPPKAIVLAAPAVPAIDPVAGKTHTIQQGEMFVTIAKKYHVSVESLIAANPQAKPTALRPGQVIRLSANDPSATPASAADPQPATAPSPAAPKSPVAATDADGPAPSVVAPKPPVAATDADDPAPSVVAPKPPVAATDDPVAVPRPTAPKATIPQEKTLSSKSEKKARAVMIDREMTYGEFAAKHDTDTRRLNELNGLELTKATVLAKGAELYVPAKP